METIYALSIDDAGGGGEAMVESCRRTCAFLEERGLRATWFVIPQPGERPLSEAWKKALQEARDAGHDLQLHGLTHADCFEFGPPVEPATLIRPAYLEEFAQRREEFMARYTVERLRERLEQGLEVFERELNLRPTVFRAPCGSVSPALFEALRQVGIRYESSQYINMGCYEHLPHRSGRPRQEWTDRWPHRPFRWHSGIVEVPILGEYTWRGAWQREEEFLALAKADVDRIAQESPVAVLLAHTHGIADNYDYAFRLFDALLAHLQAQGRCRFATLGQLAAQGALEAE